MLITGNYWAFTITDGALRMLVVMYFHQLGYSPLAIAMLFLFYEVFGVVTNLVGGWLGARLGLNRTMNVGLGLQIIALAMLMVPAGMLTVVWVMAAQALSGIAKDLNKMSAKSAVKVLVPTDSVDVNSALYRWVAMLTGSKNALKGLGFFVGGVLLTLIGFRGAVIAMAVMLCAVLLLSLWRLKADLGKQKVKPKFSEIFSKSHAINVLSAARFCLFASRDVWFVVALPVFLYDQHGWSHWTVGGLLAAWIIGYGGVQTQAPKLTALVKGDVRTLTAGWAAALAMVAILLAVLPLAQVGWLVVGLFVFGVLFAVNSSWHSYLIVHYARADGVSMDVGFYYMANAMGRLVGTILSGWLYMAYGLSTCLWVAAGLVAVSSVMALALPGQDS
ncbi:organoarsenical effux MFS transporter ArsJ [Vreelandella olivaria]|uniref:organoarsenical effux MFS transporter ArsJ n=1 Tax=Vreelandella olivaria TaxID=390919 RepID=UPI00201E85AD|nr:organoarsenical effux MFS transporter ArsJ [Halomonas olivaria]